MDLLTITAIDQNGSGMTSRSFSTISPDKFRKAVKAFEEELPYRRYELTCDELIDHYPKEILIALDDLEVTY